MLRLRLLAGMALFLLPLSAEAAGLTLRHRHFLFTVSAKTVDAWNGKQEVWRWQGARIRPPQSLRVDGETDVVLPPGMTKSLEPVIDRSRIVQTLMEDIAPSLERTAGSVVIGKDAEGTVTFEGVGIPGRTLNGDASADIILEALRLGIDDVFLAVDEPPPSVTVTDEGLRGMGIRELVSVGESAFAGSTQNRIHNIRTGLKKFNGHLIAKDETFSFVKVLGPVNGQTGYLKELTILGDKTLPDYGGGLCQVSTTAYRGAWEAGFPIAQRRNHSYTVRYYAPQGTDATVYPPHTDIKFHNDSPGALLMQTHMEGTQAFFLTYGTPVEREASIIGPFTWGQRPPPPPKTEYTPDLPPGEKKKVGDAVPGLNAAWYRFVSSGTGRVMETVLSNYEARPLFYQIGGSDPAAGSGTLPASLTVDPSS